MSLVVHLPSIWPRSAASGLVRHHPKLHRRITHRSRISSASAWNWPHLRRKRESVKRHTHHHPATAKCQAMTNLIQIQKMFDRYAHSQRDRVLLGLLSTDLRGNSCKIQPSMLHQYRVTLMQKLLVASGLVDVIHHGWLIKITILVIPCTLGKDTIPLPQHVELMLHEDQYLVLHAHHIDYPCHRRCQSRLSHPFPHLHQGLSLQSNHIPLNHRLYSTKLAHVIFPSYIQQVPGRGIILQ